MKILLDKTYLKYSFYIIFTATILYILYGIISNAGAILSYLAATVSSVLSLLSPFIIALVITYLLHPVVCWFERNILDNRKISRSNKIIDKKTIQLKRTLSVLLTYILALSILVILVYSVYAMIGGQVSEHFNLNAMLDSIVQYTQRYNELFTELRIRLEASGLSADLKQQMYTLLEASNNILGAFIRELFNFTKRLGSNLINILLGLIIAFYMLKDLEYFKKLCHDVVEIITKKRTNEKLSSLLHDINFVVSRFIRGQLLDGFIVGILSSIALMLIGLDFPVLIGMTAGIANVIPYFGPVIGSIPAVIVGLLSGSPIKALFAVLALALVQQIDGTVIAPKVIGESVGLHPVFVILSIIIGGSYFGLLGMLLAVPTAGIIKLLFVRWIESKKAA